MLVVFIYRLNMVISWIEQFFSIFNGKKLQLNIRRFLQVLCSVFCCMIFCKGKGRWGVV